MGKRVDKPLLRKKPVLSALASLLDCDGLPSPFQTPLLAFSLAGVSSFPGSARGRYQLVCCFPAGDAPFLDLLQMREPFPALEPGLASPEALSRLF